MDYSRFNYVAQPEDNVTELIGKIGPYDKFAIEYGYRPLAARTRTMRSGSSTASSRGR
jgi:hypothetical protein